MFDHIMRARRGSNQLATLKRRVNRKRVIAKACIEPLERRELLSITPLTNTPVDHRYPATNNKGDYVYCQQVDGLWQVFLNQQQVTTDSYNNLFPAISDNGDIVYFKQGGSGGIGYQVIRRSASGSESQLEFSSRNNLNGSHRDAARHPGIASDGTSISGYDFYATAAGTPTRRFTVSGIGRLGPDFYPYDYPDINVSGQLVMTQGGNVWLGTTSAPFPATAIGAGAMGRINDNGDIVVSASLSAPAPITVYSAPTHTGSLTIATGAWADINNKGDVVFENVDINGVRQVYRYTPSPVVVNVITHGFGNGWIPNFM